jgi:hypothetical protein
MGSIQRNIIGIKEFHVFPATCTMEYNIMMHKNTSPYFTDRLSQQDFPQDPIFIARDERFSFTGSTYPHLTADEKIHLSDHNFNS